jgi:hypothetical protein
MQKIDRLIQLNQKLDGIVQFEQNGDDKFKTGVALAGGAGLGFTGLKAYQGIKKKQAGMLPSGPQLELPGLETKATFGQAARSYAKDIPSIARGRASQGWSAVSRLFGKLRAAV